MNNERNEQEKKFPVREGTEQSSILHDKKQDDKDNYPNLDEKAKQVKNQPEFTEEQPNIESPNTPK
ncbi:MAG: hypothetical protein ABIU63_08885 [Chitinophagaceae bacterium]